MNWGNMLLAITSMSPVEAMLTTVVVSYLVMKGFIKLPFIKKWREDKIKRDPNDILSPHRKCVNFPSLLQIMERAMTKSDEIMHIKYIETLYDQMTTAEESWIRIRMLLRESFVRLIPTGIDERRKQEAKICYNLVLDKLGKDMIGLMRKWMKRNHLIERTEIEYQSYITQRAKDLEEFFSIAIQDVYVPTEMQVDIEALRAFNIENAMPPIIKELTSFFIKAREIAREKEAKINKIKGELPK